MNCVSPFEVHHPRHIAKLKLVIGHVGVHGGGDVFLIDSKGPPWGAEGLAWFSEPIAPGRNQGHVDRPIAFPKRHRLADNGNVDPLLPATCPRRQSPWLHDGLQILAAHPTSVPRFHHTHAQHASDFASERNELAPTQALPFDQLASFDVPPSRASFASECGWQPNVADGGSVKRRAGVGFQFVSGNETSVRGDGKTPVLSLLSCDEGTDQRHPGVAFDAIGDNGIGGRTKTWKDWECAALR